METVIASLGSAFITGAVTLIVCLVTNASERKKIAEKSRESIDLIAYKIETLTKKVEQHNKVVERTYHLEGQAELFEEKLKVANHRIDDLERRAEHDFQE